MKVYKIETAYTVGQPHYVVAESMAEAERVYLGKYWPTEIKAIECISNYVQVQGFDEQPKNKNKQISY